MLVPIDWGGVLSGEPLQWLADGLVVTLVLTAVASVGATCVAVLLTALRLSSPTPIKKLTQAFVEIFRNTPLLVQLLVWYFVGFTLLPLSLRKWLLADHPWAVLPGKVSLFAPEFLASAWGLSIFSGVFIAEEIRAGLNAVSPGQREAAASQGLSSWDTLSSVLLPQALRNAWQPIVGQYLNLMKLTSITCSIGLAEITYQTRIIESYNSHAFEAFAVGTLLYLAIGFVLERLLLLKHRKRA
jgi:polar amino acid transport system permease protein